MFLYWFLFYFTQSLDERKLTAAVLASFSHHSQYSAGFSDKRGSVSAGQLIPHFQALTDFSGEGRTQHFINL